MTGLPPGTENYRNTAPALARNAQGNPYLAQRQAPGMRPSLPPGPSQSSSMHSSRMRSASSPDIHPNVQSSRKYMSGEGVPNVPPIPSYVTKQMSGPNRSQNGSPQNMPIRTTTPTQYAPQYSNRPADARTQLHLRPVIWPRSEKAWPCTFAIGWATLVSNSCSNATRD